MVRIIGKPSFSFHFSGMIISMKILTFNTRIRNNALLKIFAQLPNLYFSHNTQEAELVRMILG